jgi:hypothetical protein
VIFKAKPEVQIGNIARKQLMVCLMELGLTPVSSARVHPLPPAKKREGRPGQLLQQSRSAEALSLRPDGVPPPCGLSRTLLEWGLPPKP